MTTNRSRPSDHGISRQAFLRGAAWMLATGAVFGTTRAAADPAPPLPAGMGLASNIGGSVLLPASGTQFASGKQVFNSLYNNSNPAAVVTVSSQADVQKAVAFATANNLKIAPRGGGHSYIGASSANGTMVIDLRGFQADRTLTAVTSRSPRDESVCGTSGLRKCRLRDPVGQLPNRGDRGADIRRRDRGRFPPCRPGLRCAAVGHGGAAQRRGGYRVPQRSSRSVLGASRWRWRQFRRDDVDDLRDLRHRRRRRRADQLRPVFGGAGTDRLAVLAERGRPKQLGPWSISLSAPPSPTVISWRPAPRVVAQE